MPHIYADVLVGLLQQLPPKRLLQTNHAIFIIFFWLTAFWESWLCVHSQGYNKLWNKDIIIGTVACPGLFRPKVIHRMVLPSVISVWFLLIRSCCFETEDKQQRKLSVFDEWMLLKRDLAWCRVTLCLSQQVSTVFLRLSGVWVKQFCSYTYSPQSHTEVYLSVNHRVNNQHPRYQHKTSRF